MIIRLSGDICRAVCVAAPTQHTRPPARYDGADPAWGATRRASEDCRSMEARELRGGGYGRVMIACRSCEVVEMQADDAAGTVVVGVRDSIAGK